MILALYQKVGILFSIFEELLNSPFNKQFDDKAKCVLSKHGLEVVEGKIVKSQRRVSAEAKENGYGESEDEKVKKELIKVFSNREKYLIDQSFGDITVSEILAWLEKQGSNLVECEQDNIEDLTDFEKAFQGMCCDKNKQFAKECCKTLLELAKKQSQPKFKIGDWVVNNGHSYLIADIDFLDNRYLFEIGGYTHEQLNWEYVENVDKNYHLWSIEDAKPGDILDANGALFIYKKHDKDYVYFYCGVNLGGEFIKANENDIWNSNNKIYPTTKEQRDTLMKAMADLGWEFDSEKKELKKIRVIDEGKAEMDYCFTKMMNGEKVSSTWSEDYTERMGQIINYLTCQAKEEPTRKKTLLEWVALLKSIFRKGLPEIQIPCTEAARKGIHRIMDVLEWAADKGRISDSDCEDYMILLSAYLPQPKPVWSEEDETGLTNTIIMLKEGASLHFNKKDIAKAVNWLETIKQRIGG